jgi:histidinol-phosphate/aromatic aminotransferase/cobyric acid decarboxylase-like protein
VYIRDRSTEPGCAGCIRIGTGIVEHTKRAIAVMDEVLCAAR